MKPEGDVSTLEIPPDGILRIKSFTPFYAWHEVSASYKSGKEIPIFGTVPDEAMALRDVRTHQRAHGPKMKRVVIGKKQQADRVDRDKLEAELMTFLRQSTTRG